MLHSTHSGVRRNPDLHPRTFKTAQNAVKINEY
jgi:hypothetical protein